MAMTTNEPVNFEQLAQEASIAEAEAQIKAENRKAQDEREQLDAEAAMKSCGHLSTERKLEDAEKILEFTVMEMAQKIEEKISEVYDRKYTVSVVPEFTRSFGISKFSVVLESLSVENPVNIVEEEEPASFPNEEFFRGDRR